MPDSGFETGTAFFDLVARQSKDPGDQNHLFKVPDIYRDLATSKPPGQCLLFAKARGSLRRDRASECRTLLDRFENPACRERLNPVAEAYERTAALDNRPWA